MIILILFVLGLCAGSFVNALVWRLHEQSKAGKKSKKQDLSIISGRSVCVNCRHELEWFDLVPLVSWIYLKGKCRYCTKPISKQYPLVELISGLTFGLSYALWPVSLDIDGQWLLLGTWLISSVGLLALAVYDVKWMLLPNKIIYPTLVVAALGRASYIILYDNNVIRALVLWASSVIIASGLFFVLFVASKGKWIGYGDVRLGLVTGTLLADPQKSLAMLFISSLIGCAAILPSLLRGQKNMATKLPYGPFLIAGTAIIIIFGDSLLDWYKGLIL